MFGSLGSILPIPTISCSKRWRGDRWRCFFCCCFLGGWRGEGGKIKELFFRAKILYVLFWNRYFFTKYKEQVEKKLVTDLQDGWERGRFWSVGGGLLPMTDLKGHGCARSLKFFKVLNYQNSGLGIKTKWFHFRYAWKRENWYMYNY